jgi:16S rRNA (uracil1498-N3)-methyltransferase
MIRVYYPDLATLSTSNILCLDGKKAHHIINVLRCKIGQNLILFDGLNTEYGVVIEKIEKKHLWLAITKETIVQRESPLYIHLIQGISKGERMDLVVQKATELGVSRITPIYTQHGAVSLSTDRMQKKEEHWKNIMISACEQCGRNTIPICDPIQSFTEALEPCDNEQSARWILNPYKGEAKAVSPLSLKSAQLLIGPEGGFSSFEVSQAHEAGFISLQLGPRVLRTETAAIAAITTLQATYGDFTALREQLKGNTI